MTVLFADLGGSTSFGERTDAELARTVMAEYHAVLQRVIDDHAGTVAKFMGDGMMATFGIPEVAEDDARRAVRAGLDAQRRFETFASEIARRHGETLTMRIGINTGEVVIAAGDADLIGDALNVAARLEKACRPGHVLVGEETWRLTRGDFGFDPLGQVSVAGRAQPVAIYEVTSTNEEINEPVAPFVGRADEMARLRSVFANARTTQSAQLVTVLGSPGVGKTRLSREISAFVAADAGARTFEIRCDRSGDATFAPVAQLIREAAGIGDETDAATLPERIAALLAADDERARVADVLAGLVGAADVRSVEETFWAIRRLVESLAAAHPLMVVIDDIQWAEPLLLDLLEHLVEWVKGVAVALVCLARPELRDVRPAFTETSRRVADVLALDGLDSAATEALAAGLLGTDRLPAGLVDRLPSSTDGNPLFVRELVRMLVDDEVIRRVGDGWELTIDADAVDVPPTIQSLLGARVERLPVAERQLLELASVVGAEFSLGALRELARDATPIPMLLESMRRKELVEPTGAYWGDEPVYRFHHVLIRDAGYRRLLKTTRAQLHERLAHWTDETAPRQVGEHETAIAFHYEQASRYRGEIGETGDEVDALGRRAAELLAVAARRALERDDLTAAGGLARRAVGALPVADVERRAEMLLVGCECLLGSGDVVAGTPLVEELATIAGVDEQLGAWAACYEAQLVSLTDPEGLVAAEATATAAAERLHELGDGAGEAKAHQVRAVLLARLGRVGEAEVVLDLALAAARAADDRRRVTAVLGAAPQAALFGPSPVARAGGRCLDVVRLLRITTASPSVEATSMRCQAVLEALRGRIDVSRTMLASARATLEELGLRHGLLETDLYTGMVELIAGDGAAAVAPLRSAYEGLGTLGVGADAGQAAALLASALLEQGDVDEAELMAAASEALAGQNLKTAIAWRVARARVLDMHGDVEAAVALAHEAVDIAAATDLMLDHADACVALAELSGRAGDPAGARAARAEAHRLYEAKGATVPAQRLGSAGAVEAPVPTVPSETGAPSAAPPKRVDETRTALAENDATRFYERFCDAANEGRFDDARALVDEGYLRVDRRSTVSSPDAHGPDEIVGSLQTMLELGLTIMETRPIAVRGERSFLGEFSFRTPDGLEMLVLGVYEIDVFGRALYTAWYDDDALAEALAELDERYFAGEGADRTFERSIAQSFVASNAGDWIAYRDSFAPEVVGIDRRTLVGTGHLDRDRTVEALETYEELLTQRLLYVRRFIRRGDALLSVLDVRATDADGSDFEWCLISVGVADPDSRTRYYELFDEGDVDAALARLDELGAGEPQDRRSHLPENEATRLIQIWAEHLRAGRLDDALAIGRADAVRVDRRKTVSLPTTGNLDDLRTAQQAAIDLGFTNLVVEPLAVRGQRSFLARLTMTTEAGDESAHLIVDEFDESGLWFYGAFYDEDDRDAAEDALDERYLAGEGAEHAGLVGASVRLRRAHRERDWDTVRDVFDPGVVFRDHRHLGWADGDRDEITRMFREGAELAPDMRLFFRSQHVVGGALLRTNVSSGTTHEGVTMEWALHALTTVGPDGRINHMEYFDEDDFDAALARLDELGAGGAPGSRAHRPENDATRLIQVWAEHLRAGRLEESFSMVRDDAVRVDHRRTVAFPTTYGRADLQAVAETAIDVGFTNVVVEPLAVRGERSFLARMALTTAEGDEAVPLAVDEWDEAGRLVHRAIYDEDDLDAAIADLDARFLAGEGAEHVAVLAAGQAWIEASRTQDVDALRAITAPDLVCVDHQPLGFGTLDREGLLAATQLRFELSADDLVIVRSVQVVGSAVLALHFAETTSDSGGRYERAACYLLVVDDAGLITRWEVFGDGDYDRALARLHELGAAPESLSETSVPEFENRAARVGREFVRLWSEGEIGAGTALLAEDMRRIDHRRTVSAPIATGRQPFIDSLGAFAEVGMVLIQGDASIATRGERLMLGRVDYRGDSWELGFLVVTEIDETGRIIQIDNYDEEDVEVALAELDRRYFLGEGAPHQRVLRVCGRLNEASLRPDLDAIDEILTPDFVLDDHQQLGFGVGGRDLYIDGTRARGEVAADGVTVYETIEIVGNALLALNHQQVITDQGSEYQRRAYYLNVVTDDDRVSRCEIFDDDQYEAAKARLHELGNEQLSVPDIENAATRQLARFLELLRGRRFDEVREVLSEEFARENRRAIVGESLLVGRDAMMENLRAIDEFDTELVADVLAVRGDRLMLARMEYRSPGGFENVTLDVIGINREGLADCIVTFDEDQLDVAFDELDERWIAGDGSGHEYLIRRMGDFRAAYADRDWAAMEDLVAEDFVFADHRPIGLPENDRAGYIRVMRESVEQTPDMRLVVGTVEILGDVVLARTQRVGATAEGFAYDWEQFAVQQHAVGLLRRVELFPVDRETDARARFEELAREPRTPYVDNRLVRDATRSSWLSARGAGPSGENVADDCVLVDHRPGVNAGEVVGGADVTESIQSGVDVFGALHLEPLAVRGDRLALYRWAFVQDAGFEAPGVCVNETNEDGLICRITSFAESDLAAARELLESRHRALSGAAYTAVEANFVAAQAAFNRRDFDAFEATMAPAMRCVDHAPLGWGTLDRAGYVGLMRAQVDLVPTAIAVSSKHLVQDDAMLAVMPLDGTTAEGSAYRWSKILVGRVDESGVSTDWVYFDVEQWDEALALLDEWSGADQVEAPGAELPTNAVMRQDELQMARFTAGDPSGALELVADSYTMVDHRFAGITPTAVGREAFLEQVGAYAAAGFSHIETRVIAVRGDRVALAWQTLGSGDGFDTVSIKLGEVDESGRFTRTEVFDEGDLPDALATLDEWYIEGEGAEHSYLIRRIGDLVHAANSGDAAAYRAMFHDDCTVENHRRLNIPMASIDDVVESERATHDVGATRTTRLPGIECRGDAALLRQHERLVTAQGSEYATDMFLVVHLTAGRFDVIESFDPEDDDAVRARFEELAVDRPTPTVDNAAVRVSERLGWLWAYCGDDEARVLLAPELTAIDRRPGVAAPDMVGPDARLANLAAVVDVFGGIDATTLAVRGERLMLLAWTISTADGFAVSGCDVTEIDEAGRICRIVTFAEDQLAEAILELEARYDEVRTEPPGASERLFRGGRLADFDWDEGYLAASAPDAVMVDHRMLGFADADRDAFRQRSLAMIEQVPDILQLTKKRYARGRADLTVVELTGTSTDGVPVEWHHASVARARPDGRLDRGAHYPMDRWDDAVAQFEEWAASEPVVRTPAVDNTAVRVLVRGVELLKVDPEEALQLFADNATGEAHETGPTRGARASSPEMWRDVLTSIAETYDDVHCEPLAARGERVAMARLEFVADGFETRALAVVELDQDDRVRTFETYGENDLVAAVDDLEERHRTVTGAAYSDGERLLDEQLAAFNRRDVDGIARRWAEDIRLVDHSPLGFGEQDRDLAIAEYHALFDQLANAVGWVARQLSAGGVALRRVETVGLTGDGAVLEYVLLIVTRLNDAGLVGEVAYFQLEQWEEALAVFDEWVAAEPSVPTGEPRLSPAVENATTRLVERGVTLLLARDPAFADVIADDAEMLSRRSVVSLPQTRGREAVVETMVGTFSVFDTAESRPIAVRGERLALTRFLMRSDGFEVVMYVIWECDGDGRMRLSLSFDPDDLVTAAEELDRRYREIAGHSYSDLERAGEEGNAVLSRGDAEGYERFLVPDVVVEDHQPLNFPPAHSSREFVAMLRRLFEVAPRNVFVTQKAFTRGRARLSVQLHLSVTPEGNTYEWVRVAVSRFNTQVLVDRIEFFPEDRWDDAVALFDEWADATDVDDHRPDSLFAALPEVFAARDWDRVRDSLAPDVELHDRRSTVSSSSVVGPDAIAELFRGYGEVGFETLEQRPVAIHGERFALVHRVYRTTTGFELAMLAVISADNEGRSDRIILFDPEDLDAATAEFEALVATPWE